jgi:putative thioredoxin
MTDISLQNFEAELINASSRAAGAARHLAPWCGPCKALGPVLEKLEVAYAGRFKLAKLNSGRAAGDRGSAVADVRRAQHSVLRAVQERPAGGRLCRRAARGRGAQVPRQSTCRAPKGAGRRRRRSKRPSSSLAQGDTDSAIDKLQEAVAINRATTSARADYLAACSRPDGWPTHGARSSRSPASCSRFTPERVWTLAGRVREGATARSPSLGGGDRCRIGATSMRVSSSRRRISPGNVTEALDELLEIIMRDKAWNGRCWRARRNVGDPRD